MHDGNGGGNGIKVIFIELDGGSWNVMRPLLEAGKLPNIKGVMEHGVSSGLASEAPYISPKIWTSIFTGKKPEKHGVSFFGATSNMVNGKRIWDILDEKGHTVGVLGSLVTWPPRPVKGFMIPDVCAIDPETHPKDYRFFQEIALNERRKSKRLGNRRFMLAEMATYAYKMKSKGVGIDTLWYAFRHLFLEKLRRLNQRDRYWRKATLYLKMSTQIFEHLYDSYAPDFSSFHIHLCDSLSHRYWMFYEPEKFAGVAPSDIRRYGDIVPNSYIEADRSIGKIISHAGDNTVVVIASDHGSRALEEGRETYDMNIDRFLEILGIAQKAVVARFGPGVYMHFQDKGLMQKTADIISEIKLRDTGEKLFYAKMHGEILVVTKAVWKVNLDEINEESIMDIPGAGEHEIREIFSRQKMKISGVHDAEGIFIAAGPGIRKDSTPENPTIYDMTPTVLALMGYPVASDMDGRVLTEIMDDDFLRKNPLSSIESYDDGASGESVSEDLDYDKIKTRLEGLGYL